MDKVKFLIAVLIYFFLLRMLFIHLFDQGVTDDLALALFFISIVLVISSKYIYIFLNKKIRRVQ